MKKVPIKFAQISDLHIHQLKFHKEQQTVFDKICEHMRHEKVDYIAMTGDLFHVKGSVTPEAYSMAASFLKELADIAPLHMIVGNHDLILSNKNRMDSISPVVEALDHSNIFLHKQSKEIDLGEIVLNVMSMADKDNYKKVSDKSRINIGLYHGAVLGCKTEQGFALEH